MSAIASNDQSAYWVARLEELKELENCATYTKLAASLGMRKQMLANVRRGEQELSVEAKLEVFRRLDFAIAESDYLRLFPPRIRVLIDEHIAKIFDPHDGNGFFDGFWVARLDDLKRKFGVRTDRALAKALSIPPSTISEVRAGNNSLSTVAKVRILDHLTYKAAVDLLLDLLPRRVKKRAKVYEGMRFVARGETCAEGLPDETSMKHATSVRP